MPNNSKALNKYDFTALVKNPNNIGEIEIEKLRDLVQTYPYFSVARNLLVKSLYKSSHYEYDSALKQAALQTGNRTVLYNLVHDLPLNTDSLVFGEQVVEELEISRNNDITEEKLVQTETNIEERIAPTPTVERIENIPSVALNQTPNEADVFKIETETNPVVKAVEPIVSKVERFEMPDEEEIPPIFAKPRSTEITEEEQLVKPTGKFVKFIPKKPAKENKLPPSSSLIQTKKEEEVLNEFDISSLNTIGNWQPSKPLYVETPEPTVEEIKPVEAKAETVTPAPILENETTQVETTTIAEPEIVTNPIATIEIPEIVHFSAPSIEPDVIVPSSVIKDFDGKTEASDNDFLNWLLKKEAVKIEEDVNFVENFTQAFSEQSNNALVNEINSHLPKVKEITESETISPVVEKKALPEFEFIFDFGKQEVAKQEIEVVSENVKEEIAETDLLASLASYEIDIFLAQVYKSVKFDGHLFDQQFSTYFPEIEKPVYAPIEVALPKIEPIVTSPKVEVQVPQKQKKAQETEIHIPKFVPFEVESLAKVAEVKEISPIVEEKPEFKPKREVKSVESILEKFIRENPTIARPKSEFYNPVNMAKQSVESDEELVSETLAAIYLRQGLHKKAINMYEKLGLLYPDKLAYFAGLIEKIKNENNLN